MLRDYVSLEIAKKKKLYIFKVTQSGFCRFQELAVDTLVEKGTT